MYFLLLASIFLLPNNLFAQFYTAKSDSSRIRPYSFIKKKGKEISEEKTAIATRGEEEEEKNIPPTLRKEEVKSTKKDSLKGKEVSEEIFGKLNERLNVCLPLDFLKVSSKYGTRKDPITRCATFHDGVDLACKKEEVYSMLPAVVKKVHRGKKGYGNYVILNHGRLECLYGHLEEITVKEKEVINAGTIVGLSGNTGKSTGYHLHIRLRKEGKSVDPLVFIAFLETYIKSLNQKLAHVVKPRERIRHSLALNLSNVREEIIKQRLLYPHIVLAQAALETGNFSSRVCWEYNNLFGLRRPSNGEYYRFARWEDSVAAYRDYVQYKYQGGNYYAFLDKIGYAEDKFYIQKVRQMVNTLGK